MGLARNSTFRRHLICATASFFHTNSELASRLAGRQARHSSGSSSRRRIQRADRYTNGINIMAKFARDAETLGRYGTGLTDLISDGGVRGRGNAMKMFET